MKIGVMLPVGDTEGPTGGVPSWADVRAIAEAVENNGLDSVWLADHFLYRPGGDDPRTYGMHEAWTLLSGVAAVTERIELGTMVLCASFRDPGLTAKMAATLDLMSGGRVILGVGAGWHDPEYEAFGLPTDHRVGRFAEWLEIVARLVRKENVTFEGQYHQVRDAELVPAPEREIPILVAARRPRMLELTAQWADAWNTAWFGVADDRVKERLAELKAATDASDRPEGAVAKTVGIAVRDPDQPAIDEPSPSAVDGSVEELAAALREYAGLGVDHLIVAVEPVTPRSVERLAEAARLLG
ncbi:putative F420-dependent oxidoreductase [Kribbella voronezhensis]|uniref:Putative F420-dependent oxidoreductase n=1 Tax=Kribbella voronezhensis TaxID=2512212 RepID=A0A4R7TBZ6_9ACTN|nr:LLM class flavin-dependent oxidoreductase [Kribbella voronezhensis]TDU89584.1 putative F420-dependent oxidoreductase [Kribbella voronezhensis]